MLPKYKLHDQVQIVSGGGTTVVEITGIKQDSTEDSYRYETTVGSDTRFFGDESILAVNRNGTWEKV